MGGWRMANAAQGMEEVQPNEVMDAWVALEVVCMCPVASFGALQTAVSRQVWLGISLNVQRPPSPALGRYTSFGSPLSGLCGPRATTGEDWRWCSGHVPLWVGATGVVVTALGGFT
jgi:hypothetical protein